MHDVWRNEYLRFSTNFCYEVIDFLFLMIEYKRNPDDKKSLRNDGPSEMRTKTRSLQTQ